MNDVQNGSGEARGLGERIAVASRRIDAAMHGLLTDLRRFDAIEGWAEDGALSAAHWLNWRVGLDLGAARERVRVARALETLPVIDAALGDGELSYSKVRALTRVATSETEALLVDIARQTTASQLERIVRRFRLATGD